MIAGGQSATSISLISTELDDIANTLNTIKTELAEVVTELEEIQCGFDQEFISQYAGQIQGYYLTYYNWVSDMQKQGTKLDIDKVTVWANCVVGNSGYNCQDNDIVTLLNDLNDAAVPAGGGSGSIHDCIKTKGGKPPANTLDDRPYYTNNVVPITDWYLTINTQAIIVLTEAYHFLAWLAQGQPVSQTSDDIIPNICPSSGSMPSECASAINAYPNYFLPVAKAQLQAGGAPYSTDDFLMQNGQNYLLAFSLEKYTLAQGNTDNCEMPLTSTNPCGVTAGLYNDTLTSIPYGPYAYGGTGGGTWATAPESLFNELLSVGGWNGGSGRTASDYLCTMSMSGGDLSNCTQDTTGAGNGGSGLSVGKKIILFNETANVVVCPECESYVQWLGPFQCFFDGNITAGLNGIKMPFCQEDSGNRWDSLYENNNCEKNNTKYQGIQGLDQLTNGSEGSDPSWYVGSVNGCTLHLEPPQYSTWSWSSQTPTIPQYLWPALEWSTLTCSDGKTKADTASNPVGVPTLCGADFDIWFNTVVPPAPTATITQSLNATTIETGDTLSVGVTIKNDLPQTDYYMGAMLPDGNTLYFLTSLYPTTLAEGFLDDPSSWRPLSEPKDMIPVGVKVHFPKLFFHTFTGDEPLGYYQVFSGLSWPNAFADGWDDGDFIALDIDTVTVKGLQAGGDGRADARDSLMLDVD